MKRYRKDWKQFIIDLTAHFKDHNPDYIHTENDQDYIILSDVHQLDALDQLITLYKEYGKNWGYTLPIDKSAEYLTKAIKANKVQIVSQKLTDGVVYSVTTS